jgi:hypothetical protein
MRVPIFSTMNLDLAVADRGWEINEARVRSVDSNVVKV